MQRTRSDRKRIILKILPYFILVILVLIDQLTKLHFKNLSENGIKAALISNNKPERIEKYNALLSLPAYPDSKKPSTKAILRAIEQMGVTIESTAGLGDQLLTDTLAVHRLDMTSLIVPPIKDKKTPFFRFKRLLEKPFIKRLNVLSGVFTIRIANNLSYFLAN